MSDNHSNKDLEYIYEFEILLETKSSDYSISYIKKFPKPRHKKLEEYVAENGGILKVSGEFDWGEPVGREIW